MAGQFVLNVRAVSKRYDFTNKVLLHMENLAHAPKSGKMQGSILLAGDPGVGKTSFIKALSRLLGLKEVVVEAPHITEEHLINIPFIVFDPIKNKTFQVDMPLDSKGNIASQQEITQYDPKSSRIVLADSYMFTRLMSQLKASDDDYLAEIYNPAKTDILTRNIFEKFGGAPDKVPDRFARLRERFHVIFFLDEYFRQTSPRIRNVLRSILNGRIGNHQLPQHVYCIYATNLEDEQGSISEIQANTHFAKTIEIKAATEEEWFAWMESKYDGLTKVNLHPKVLQAFYELMVGYTSDEMALLTGLVKNIEPFKQLNDEEKKKVSKLLADPKVTEAKLLKIVEESKKDGLKFLDSSTEDETRISPRRWEQIILYVNASLPVKDLLNENGQVIRKAQDQARDLLASVKTNFGNYLTGSQHSATDPVLKLVCSLIQRTSKVKVRPEDATSEYDWRETLSHQIQIKKKLGDYRKYLPVMSGPPGIGKTSVMAEIAEHNRLLYIPIDCSTLNADDVTGLPLSKSEKEDLTDIHTEFSEPPLYKLIEKLVEAEDRNLKARWTSEYGKERAFELYAQFKRQPHTILLFFDELSRVKNMAVFNSIRKLLLEKKFNDKYELGPKFICVAALNPEDQGAIKLTSHVRDVLDIIKSSPKWSQTQEFLAQVQLNVDKSAIEITSRALNAVVNAYKTKDTSVPVDQREFHMMCNANDQMYLSPRLYTDLYRDCATMVDSRIQLIDDDSNPQDVADDILNTMCNVYEEALRLPLKMSGAEAPEFMERIYTTLSGIEINVFKQKVAEATDFKSIYAKWRKNPQMDITELSELDNYFGQLEREGTDAATITDDIWHTLNPQIVKELEGIPAKPKKLTASSFTDDPSAPGATAYSNLIKGLIWAAIAYEHTNILAQIETGVYYSADDYYGPMFNALNAKPELDEVALEPILVMDKVLSEISDVVHPG